MNAEPDRFRYAYGCLLAFAATAVASIALQNLVWVAVILFLYSRWKDRLSVQWPRGPLPTATLVFLASFFAAALWGIDPAHSFTTVHKYLTFLLLFFVGAMPLLLSQVRKLLVVFVHGAAVCAFYGIAVKHFIQHQDRIDSFSGDKMVFGGMLMAAFLLTLAFLIEERGRSWLWADLALIAPALLFTQTRGAWIGCLAGSVLLLWRLNRKWLMAGALVLFACVFLLPGAYLNRVRSIGDVYFTYNAQHEIVNASPTRVLIWVAGCKIIKDHPWGVGQGNLERIYPSYRLDAMRFEPDIPHLHDNFLQVLAQNGWVGLAAYLAWIAAYYFSALRYRSGGPLARDLNWTLLSVFTAVLVWGVTEYTFSHQFMNVQFFLLGLQVRLWNIGEAGGGVRTAVTSA